MDRSLLVRDADATAPEPRYRLLETLRAFAGHRLDEHPAEALAARARHRGWALGLARGSYHGLRTADQLVWLTSVDAAADDLRAATASALKEDPTTALRLGCAAAWYWWLRDEQQSGAALLEAALAATDDVATPDLRGRAGRWLSFLLFFSRLDRGEAATALARARAELSLVHRVAPGHEPSDGGATRGPPLPDDDDVTALVLEGFLLAATGGPLHEALEGLAAAGTCARGTGDVWTEATAAYCRAEVLLALGRTDEAATAARGALVAGQASGDRWVQLQTLGWLGHLSVALGEADEAVAVLSRAVELATDMGMHGYGGVLAVERALAVLLSGDTDTAAASLADVLARAPAGACDIRALARHGQGLLAQRSDRHEEAAHAHAEAAELFAAAVMSRGRAEALAAEALARSCTADVTGARAAVVRALEAVGEVAPPATVAYLVEAAASVALGEGDGRLAALRLGWSAASRRATGLPLVGAERREVERVEAGARRLAGDTTVGEALASGAAASLDEVLAHLPLPLTPAVAPAVPEGY